MQVIIMETYDSDLYNRVIQQMRRERIQDFSEEEIDRVFADFDLPEKMYREMINRLLDGGFTIEDVYAHADDKDE